MLFPRHSQLMAREKVQRKEKTQHFFRSQDRSSRKPRNEECEKTQFASECLNIRDGLLGNHRLTFEISEFNFLTSTCHF